MKDIQALIFDMDGLLLDTETVGMRAWTGAGRKLGIEMTEAVYRTVIGITSADCQKKLIGTFGPQFPLDDFLREAWHAYQHILETEGIPVKPGTHEILDWAAGLEIPCGVGTSTNSEKARARLEQCGILEKIRHLTGGDMVTRGKPDPETFLSVAAALGVDPAHCVVFEDSYSGVRAAKAANMRVIMVPDMLPPTAEMEQIAMSVCGSLDEARMLLAKEYFPAPELK